jgi:hypothetical protein
VSGARKQDESGVHHTTAANAKQDASTSLALLARPGAMQEMTSEQVELRTHPRNS